MSKRERIDALERKVEALQGQVTQLLAEDARRKILVPEVTWQGGVIPEFQRQTLTNKQPPDIKHFEQKAHQPRIRDLTKGPVPHATPTASEALSAMPTFVHPRRGVGTE